MNRYQKIFSQLVLEGKGQHDGLFVTKPGVVLIKNGDIVTNEAKVIAESLNIYPDQNDDLLVGEFCARITYLAFPKEMETAEEARKYHEKMHELGHLSVYKMFKKSHVFLIAGCSLETALEFIAHNEGRVARLTSSKTKAMDEPFYRLQGNDAQQKIQREIVENYISKRESVRGSLSDEEKKENREFINMTAPGSKCTAFLIGMDLMDWHRTLIGRLDNVGVETEMQEVCEMVRASLKKVDKTELILTKDEYYALNNSAKQDLPS